MHCERSQYAFVQPNTPAAEQRSPTQLDTYSFFTTRIRISPLKKIVPHPFVN